MRITRVVGQCLGGPILTRGNKVPNEALDILITTVMQQAVGEKGSADCFHISFLHRAFKTTVSQDVVPPTPTKDRQTILLPHGHIQSQIIEHNTVYSHSLAFCFLIISFN